MATRKDRSPKNPYTLATRNQLLAKTRKALVSEGTLTPAKAKKVVSAVRQELNRPGGSARQKAATAKVGRLTARSTTKAEGKGLTKALRQFDVGKKRRKS